MPANAHNVPLSKPSITAVIGAYLSLRRTGKEAVALCPFHADKRPSLSVNEAKGLFHCYGCQASGDVIDFIQRIEQTDFKGACATLKARYAINCTTGQSYRPAPRPHQAEAEQIVSWARTTSINLSAAMREINQEVYIYSLARKEPAADQEFLAELKESLVRQWVILSDLDDDLNNPDLVLELWAQRDDIDSFVWKLT